ncbi:MAG: aminotransferase class I/II-fold pyridoxal phosphate-dependent enzyme [Acidimicrobiales bacterium]
MRPAGGPAGGFVPPAYPYDRLVPARRRAEAWPGGAVDLSVGTPTDPPPEAALAALAGADQSGWVRGYPPSVGAPELLDAIVAWTARRFGVELAPDHVGACVGTKELVATLPRWLALRTPGRDTVLYPALSYPTYSMGAQLAGLRAVPVPAGAGFRMDLAAVDPADAGRALLLWVNSPGNPAGQIEDLVRAASWGRDRSILVASDECYVELTWDGPGRTILESGTAGVLAVHSLSKRSNLAGLRLGWYAGDPGMVAYLRQIRKHLGMMVPGPVQLAGVAALSDQDHVDAQRALYQARLARMGDILAALGVGGVGCPGGGLYLWAPAPGGDGWAFTERLAAEAGVVVSPGELYGPAGAGHVRIAMVSPMDRLDLVAERLGL